MFRPDAGKFLGVGISAVGAANNTQTVVYPAATFQRIDGTSWSVRSGARGFADADLGINLPSGYTLQKAIGASANPVLAVSTRPGITSNPTADSVSVPGSNSPYRAQTIEITETVAPTPTYETLVDDFNRADGLLNAGVGGGIWNLTYYYHSDPTNLRVIGNQLGDGIADWQSAHTKRLFEKDCDILIDCVVPPAAPNLEFGIFWLMVDAGTAPFDCYGTFWGGGTWFLRRYLNGTNMGTITSGAAPLLAGDTMWIYKRGSTIRLYRKPAGGVFTQVFSATDANHNVDGTVAIELSDTTQRWDNFRGGPIVGPPVPLDETIIDDFNRADGLINAGLGAKIWRSATCEGGNIQAIYSNQLGLSPSGGSSGDEDGCISWAKLARDFDLLVDCVNYVSGEELRVNFCVENWGSYTTLDGTELYSYGTEYKLRDNIVGGTSQELIAMTGPAWTAGSTIWISKRGSTITVYHRPSGGEFVQVAKTTGATRWDRAGYFAFKHGSFGYSAARFDNLRGGPLIPPPRSVVVI